MAVPLTDMLKKSRPARWLLTALLGIVTLGMFARYVVMPMLAWTRAQSAERPMYTVVGSISSETLHGHAVPVELRHYETYLVAEVELPEGLSQDEQRKEGFGQVARYIFGDNLRRRSGLMGRWFAWTHKEGEQIAMTAPVQQELHPAVQASAHEEKHETAKVSFIMPSMYKAIHELPVPRNGNITLRAVPTHYAAVVGFRGAQPSPHKVAEYRFVIGKALEHQGLKVEESRGVMVYQYHDPIATPNMLRWNEVVIWVHPHGVENFEN
mmetsp:Transcript_29279/g.66336  ORF Transcript_29279/g.66336 Transcript_29279/m.66336 type:complete len:267 (-) Transcript_29279:209-1009(-)